MADKRYLVLARKWRPTMFEDVVGQEHITRTLQNAITSGRIGHAFLFIGSRGIGKTTTARILAKALNCLAAETPTPRPCGQCDNCTSIGDGTNLDVIEIDGASNNSVEDVREIREHIRLVPSRARYKIYIIDEVHQLSAGAFNALLKTLEEPPAHAVFILATTEAHRIPATIISRCQRYDFRRVGVEPLCDLLRGILAKEQVRCTEEALCAIARAAEGSVRDSESILDQLVSYCDKEITYQDVVDVLGLVDWNVLHDLCGAIQTKDVAKQLQIVETVVASGKDLSQFVEEILRYFRNVLVCKTADAKALLALPEEEIAQLRARADQFSLTGLIRLVEQFAELSRGFDSQLAQRIALEALLIRLSRVGLELSVDTVIEKLLALSGKQFQHAPPPQPIGNTAPVSAPVPALSELPAPKASVRAFKAGGQLEALWSGVVEGIREEQLNLAVWLAHARPVRVEGPVLVLEFSAQQVQARRVVERPEHRQAVERVLAGLADDVKTFRTEMNGEEPTTAESEAPRPVPFAGHASADEARSALTDPHVAKVVDIFKGQIVQVRRSANKPGHRDHGQ